MAQVTITINSREYGIACDDGQEARILKLAAILDQKARQLTAGGGQINENMLLAMSGLLLADDLLEARRAGTSQPAEPQVKIVEKIIEKPVEPDYHETDEQLSQILKNVATQIEEFAKVVKEM